MYFEPFLTVKSKIVKPLLNCEGNIRHTTVYETVLKENIITNAKFYNTSSELTTHIRYL
jgi:hypothetical protein